jgi:ribonuclease D
MLQIIKNIFFPLRINHITDNNSLQDLCKKIEQYKICAIDTEFMRNKTYYPILCLIQVNVNDKLYIIDPISYKLNLAGIYKILANKNIKKIIHSARHDLEVLFFNKKIKNYQNIIDTQIMANFCHLNHNIGYKLLTKKLCHTKLSDESQRSNWKKRPLTSKQIKYAALDVKYLIKIYYKLDKKLQGLNRKSWFEWEMSDFLKKNKSYNPSEPENLIKRFSLNKKSSNYIQNITSLAIIRDNIAQKINLPRNFVIHDDLIEKIMQYQPKSLSDLAKFRSLNKKIPNQDRENIIAIFNNNIAEDDEENVFKNNKLNKRELANYNKSKKILSEISVKYKIDKSFIITDKNLKAIIGQKDQISKILQNWRYEIFGKKIKSLSNKA